MLEANVDDLDPRVWPEVLAALMSAGAADAWLTPILMKKGRPAHTLSVLCRPGERDRIRDLVLSTTSTFGVREHAVDRVALQRDWRTLTVHGSSVRPPRNRSTSISSRSISATSLAIRVSGASFASVMSVR